MKRPSSFQLLGFPHNVRPCPVGTQVPQHPYVTQEMLVEYQQAQRAAERLPSLRKQILQLLDKGALIEPGPIQAAIHEPDMEFTKRRELLVGQPPEFGKLWP